LGDFSGNEVFLNGTYTIIIDQLPKDGETIGLLQYSNLQGYYQVNILIVVVEILIIK